MARSTSQRSLVFNGSLQGAGSRQLRGDAAEHWEVRGAPLQTKWGQVYVRNSVERMRRLGTLVVSDPDKAPADREPEVLGKK